MHAAYGDLLKCYIKKGIEFQTRISEMSARAAEKLHPRVTSTGQLNNKHHPGLHLTLIPRSCSKYRCQDCCLPRVKHCLITSPQFCEGVGIRTFIYPLYIMSLSENVTYDRHHWLLWNINKFGIMSSILLIPI